MFTTHPSKEIEWFHGRLLDGKSIDPYYGVLPVVTDPRMPLNFWQGTLLCAGSGFLAAGFRPSKVVV